MFVISDPLFEKNRTDIALNRDSARIIASAEHSAVKWAEINFDPICREELEDAC
jgi:hypothetical protein